MNYPCSKDISGEKEEKDEGKGGVASDEFSNLEELAQKINLDRLPHGFVSQFTEESAVFSLIKVKIPKSAKRVESIDQKEDKTMIVQSWDKSDDTEGVNGVEEDCVENDTKRSKKKKRRRRWMVEEKRGPPELAACLVIEVRL